MRLFQKIFIFNALLLIAIYLFPNNTYANELVFSVKPASPCVSVRLPANPSTGYQWVIVKYDSTLMRAPVSRYIPKKPGLIGATGYTVWKFRFKGSAFSISRTTRVILEYKRPWEKGGGDRRTIRFKW